MNHTGERNRFNIDEPQSEKNAEPNTLASAASISPVHKLTFITGTVQIATIVPPVAGFHVLFLIFTNGAPGTLLTSGNILTAVVPTQNVPCMMLYDPIQRKYYGCANNVT